MIDLDSNEIGGIKVMKIRKAMLTGFVVLAGSLTASATLTSASAQSEQGNWLVRLRAIDVVPHESASISTIGGTASIDSKVVPELDFSYFFTPNIAAELILATSKHNITAVGTSLGDVPVGSVWLLPPTLTAQYHFLPDSRLNPYIGAGINYTIFYKSRPAGGAVTSVGYSDKVAPALQAGVDFMLDDHLLLNLDVKKIWIKTTASLNGGAIEADTKINPWIFGAGIGYRF
jgi:outer membrane protein